MGYDVSGIIEPWREDSGPPWDTRDKDLRTCHTDPERAWADYHWIQLNHEARVYAIVIDVDTKAWHSPGYPFIYDTHPAPLSTTLRPAAPSSTTSSASPSTTAP